MFMDKKDLMSAYKEQTLCGNLRAVKMYFCNILQLMRIESYFDRITRMHDVIFPIPPLQKSPLHWNLLLGKLYQRSTLFRVLVRAFILYCVQATVSRTDHWKKIANIYSNITIEFRTTMFALGSFLLRFLWRASISIPLHQGCIILYTRKEFSHTLKIIVVGGQHCISKNCI